MLHAYQQCPKEVSGGGKKGLRKREIEVLSAMPLHFVLSRNMKLGHFKERYISLLVFFQLFDAGNPR